ncbi:MAG TPA: pinensin family lanthipeptide [Longimicrobium sp.]|jgi:hypothetical protein
MKKLQLNVESLRVESFVTDATTESRGTVHAHSTHSKDSACQTYGTTCWAGCGGISGNETCHSCNYAVSECIDCEI